MSKENKPIDDISKQLENMSSSLTKDLEEIKKKSSSEQKSELPIKQESSSEPAPKKEIHYIKKQCSYNDLEIADIGVKATADTDYVYYCIEHFKETLSVSSLKEFAKVWYEVIPISKQGEDYLNEIGYYKIKSEIESEEKLKKQKEKQKEIIKEPTSIEKIKEKIKNEIKIILKKPILLKQTELEDLAKKSESLSEIPKTKINETIKKAIEELINDKSILAIDLEHKDYVKYIDHINVIYKMPKNAKKFYALTKHFEANYAKLQREVEVREGEHPRKPKEKEYEEEKVTGDIEETIYTCSLTEDGEQKLPDLTGIYNYYEEVYKYFIDHNVIIPENLLRKILLSIEKDTPLILYGEPGDGKSLIAKTTMDFLCFYYNGGENKMEGKKITDPINPNAIKGSPYGVTWESRNIDESTNPLTLFGGYSPESIGGGAKEKAHRKQTTDLGVVSICVRDGSYLFLDEMNRTENEVLGRMMGFLQEPYFYKVPEGNFKFVLKEPSSADPRMHRSNLVFIGTMNIGDVGNFKMSFAFKRRFKIIQVHYTTEFILKIVNMIKGWNKKDINKLNNSFPSIFTTNPSVSDLINELDNMLKTITTAIFEKTHEWKNLKVVTFGVGVAHINAVLGDIALYMQDLLLRKYRDKKFSILSDNELLSDIIHSIEDAVDENVIMSLIDENDRYKLEQIKEKRNELISIISGSVKAIVNYLFSNLEPITLNSKIEDFYVTFSDIIKTIFKWSKLDLVKKEK